MRKRPTCPTWPTRPVVQACFILSFAIICGGCGSSQPQASIAASYDKDTGRLQRLDYDSDKDGRIDTVSYMNGDKVVLIQIDKNSDGKVERWEYYGQKQELERVGFSRSNDGIEDAWSYQGPDNRVARIDVAVQRDGKVNRREFYEADVLVRAEEVEVPAGDVWKPTRWETYDPSGRLLSLAFDTAGRGTPDRRLVYDADGTARLELDPDADGRFEVSPQGGR